MITCPFCQKPVLLSSDSAKQIPMEDNQTDDFYCPTFVQVCEGRRWCHYWRRTNQGGYPEYCAHMPPFTITWSTNGGLTVEQFAVTITPLGDSELTYNEIIVEKQNTTFQDFIQTTNRFKILVPFS